MNTVQLIDKLKHIKIVPVIALDNAADAVPLGEALVKGGLPVAEITFRSEAAEEAIRRLRDANPNILIGAGTVLNARQVLAAKHAGADFIVTPGFNANTVKFCQDIDIPVTPGINNPMAIEAALELGINAVKFFPAEASGGIKMLKSLLAPYAMLQVMPTGGVNADNIRDYLGIKNVIACGGSWMVERKLLQQQNWKGIESLCKEAVAAL